MEKKEIIGFKGLHAELGGLYTKTSLQVMASTNRLPLTRQYSEGNRAFNPVEVQRFKAEVEAKRVNTGKSK